MESAQPTFLLTDLEGSTRRWEEHGDAMPGALARHDELVGAAIAAAGGRVVKHTGDGLLAVFDVPADAVRAAAAAQRALGAEDFEAVDGLRIRASVHTGDVVARGDDFFGPTLNRSARLLAVAHPGQTLVSSAVAAVVGPLPDGLVLTDLGEHRLRDLGQPTRLFHLDGPGLIRADDLPRLRTLEDHSSLPVQVSSFVGRADELAAITDLLDRARLVTLTGPGGCGKTRLALQVAADRLDRHPDGVVFADLGPVREPEGVAAALAAALGVRGEGGGLGEAAVRRDLDRIADRLGSGRVLVVLDTCEHVVDAAAEVAADLLRRCPHATVLATSREALQVPGEHVWPVPPLALPDAAADALASEAVELFCERARAADPTFTLDAANAAAVVEICRRLDGMPLALELAAVRLRTLSAVEVAERLDRRLSLLGAASRRGTDRQQTMRATLDWSHDLLGDDERALLRRLAVFEGGFTLAAAEQVTGLDGLDELVGRSLVVRDAQDGRSRYRLLELVREYAAAKLDEAGERAAVEARHRDWALAHVAAAPGPADGGRVPWLAPEYANLRAALRRAIAERDTVVALHLASALIPLWFNVGPLTEGAKLIEAAIALGDGPCDHRYYLMIGACYLWMWQGERERARAVAQRAREFAPTCEHVRSPHLAEILLAVLAADRDEALALCRTARAGAVAMGYRADEGFVDFVEATQYLWDGELDRAQVLLDRALEVPPGPDAQWVVVAHVARVALTLAQGRAAAEDAQRVLGLVIPEGNTALVVSAKALGAVALDDAALLAEAVALSRRMRGAPLVICVLAAAALEARAGRWEAAARLLGAAPFAPDLGLSARWGEMVGRRVQARVREHVEPSRWTELQAEGRAADLDTLVDAVVRP